MLFDGRLARGNDNYRAFRYPWTGRPALPPKVVAKTAGGKVTAHVSWNGATDVARWQLLAGPTAETMVPVAEAARSGFETAVSATTAQPLVAAAGLRRPGERARFERARQARDIAVRVALVTLAASAALAALAAPASAAEVSAYPLPGTLTASPGSQISLRGAPKAKLGRIVVTGSRSGTSRRRAARALGRQRRELRPQPRVPRRRAGDGPDGAAHQWGHARGLPLPRRAPAAHRCARPGRVAGRRPGDVQRYATRPDLAPPRFLVDARPTLTRPG